jgi:hypothetical protein
MEENESSVKPEESTQSEFPASHQSSDALMPRSTEIPAPAVLRRQVLHENMRQTAGKNDNYPSGP